MADNGEVEETAPKGIEWEVVSLTASAYAAAPGPNQVDSSQVSQGKLDGETEGETSGAMFMSGHFVFPPSQNENLSLEPEHNDKQNEEGSEYDVSQLSKEDLVKSDEKDGESVSIEGLISDDFSGIQTFGDKGNDLSIRGADFEKDVTFDKEQNIYSTTECDFFQGETAVIKSNTVKEDEGTDYSIETLGHAFNAGLSDLPRPVEGDNYDGADSPHDAWWKRWAVSLYASAKEANAFWSIFVAAAVMGLVIIGHQWQQDRWRVLHLKWQSGMNDEKMGRMLGPLSRLKDAIVGGHRQGSLVRGSTSAEL